MSDDRPSMADYQQGMDDAVAVLLVEAGIPQEVWDSWTESTAEWHEWLKQREAAILARMPRFVRITEEPT